MWHWDNIAKGLRRLAREEDGPTVVEYAVLLGLIVLVAMASIRAIGEKMYLLYEIINAATPNT